MDIITTKPDNPIVQTTSHWYALYVMPRSEKKVEEKLCSKGFKVYVPCMDSIRVWSDRKKKITIPIIPSIVFVNMGQDDLARALNTLGVVRVIRYNGKPAIIRDYEIENLRILTQQNENFEFVDMQEFEEGESVQVVQGCFYGLVAQYVRMQGKYRVVVALHALNSFIEVNVPHTFLQKLNTKVA